MDLHQEKQSVDRLRAEWQDERSRLDIILRDCGREHSSPPNNYWQDEHWARRRYEVAKQIYLTLGGQELV